MKIKPSFLFKALCYISCALFFTIMASCVNDDSSPIKPLDNNSLASFNENDVVPGVINVKFEPETGEAIEANLNSAGTRAFAGFPQLESLAENIKIKEISRLFPHAGKFEPRTRKHGLHLWYKISFEQQTGVTRAATDLGKVEGIQIIEPVPIIKIIDGDVAPLTQQQAENLIAAHNRAVYTGNVTASGAGNDSRRISSPQTESGGFPFDDPRFPDQWHYANDAYSARSDINVLDAWKKQTGHPDIIVSIVDGGIDYTHSDLAANIWINEAEMNGVTGVDDDNNGYVDDIRGWNGCINSGVITAHKHGTHVAGTVAAVNNNGIGVCGVAGGDGTPGSGIRLMSCQIFAPNPAYPEYDLRGHPAPMIKYGADNGAVISQNSWGSGAGRPLDTSVRDAIDYFIEYAGFDENGVQVGPMAGGIFIAASGNDNTSVTSYPAAYEPVVAVSSIGPNFAKASYSNYGTWVDITAPGGADYSPAGVLSTLPGEDYDYYPGTSMACPHVSGIAALMVSEYGVGQQGYTPELLRERLLRSVNDIDRYNSNYVGMLGSGLVDATKALYEDEGIAPNAVTSIEPTWDQPNAFSMKWSHTADPDLYAAAEYVVYVETEPFTQEDITQLTAFGTLKVSSSKLVGDEISCNVSNLSGGTRYYVAVVAQDIFGNRSSAAFTSGQTTPNLSPVVTMNPDKDIVIGRYQASVYNFDVVDPEGHTWRVSLPERHPAISITTKDTGFDLKINAAIWDSGRFDVVINIIDEYNATTEITVPVEILEDEAPVQIKEFEDITFKELNKTVSIDLAQYFSDPDGQELTYVLDSSARNVADIGREGSVLIVTSKGFGEARITVTAKDEVNSTEASFSVTVGEDPGDDPGDDPGEDPDPTKPMELYPNPVSDRLNIRMSGVNGTANVKLYNAIGMLAYDGNVAITPSTPGAIEVSGLSSGTYTVIVNYNGTEHRGTIVKI